MTRICLKNKKHPFHIAGDIFTEGRSLRLSISYSNKIKFKEDLMKLLKKYFNLNNLNRNNNKKGRGSLSHSLGIEKRCSEKEEGRN